VAIANAHFVMTKHIPLTVVYEAVDDGWTQATIAEHPAVITAAPTREEAKVLVVDALHEYLRSLEQERDEPLSPDADSELVELLISA
jgi:predicted RNase H-like HicB family nuclease